MSPNLLSNDMITPSDKGDDQCETDTTSAQQKSVDS